jgi:hypothetical protein
VTDLQGLAVQSVALRVLGDKVAERAAAVKQELADAMTVGDRKTAALGDGTVVGSITYAKASWTAKVTDSRALARWVQLHYPDEVEPTVRPAFLSAILAASKQACLPMTPDGTLDVPGIAVVKGDPYISIRPDKAAEPALIDAIRANQALALEDR